MLFFCSSYKKHSKFLLIELYFKNILIIFMKYILLLLLVFATLTLQAQNRSASVTQDCNKGYVYVVIDYGTGFGFGQQMSNTFQFGGFLDNFSAKRLPADCGIVALNNYRKGYVLRYKNSGCTNNPGKKPLTISAYCSSCTSIKIFTTTCPAAWTDCNYEKESR